MERELQIKDSGKVIDILENLKERPAMSKEVLGVLPAIAQDLRDGVFVKEVRDNLDGYIRKSVIVEEVLGQIDLVLGVRKE
jgi:uncharacterized protein YeeX (DUF496 family)